MRKSIVIGISLIFFIGIISQASAKKIKCWDLNENYDCDIETEDMNNDGKCNKRDCETEEPCYAIPQTGQTLCYDANGEEIGCAGTGQDGEYQYGTPWPEPRFTDNLDGTVTDNLTGLIWLQIASCGGIKTWADALTFANSLYDGWDGDGSGGDCGLLDGSLVGEWHLPNIRELHSLIDYGNWNKALPSGHPFTDAQPWYYWSSTTNAYYSSEYAWWVSMDLGHVGDGGKDYDAFYVWPVRGGN